MGRPASTAAGTRAVGAALAVALLAVLAMGAPPPAEAATGSISGTVTDVSHQGIDDVCVSADGIGNNDSGDAVTDASGAYTATGLGTGNFAVSFTACGTEDYVSEYYDDKASFEVATPVAVTDGQDASGIDASLADGGSISGTVTAQSTGLPLSGACVEVSGPTPATVSTGALGNYVVRNLAPGAYTVSFRGCVAGNFVSEFYDNVTVSASAAPVTVVANAATADIDADLAPAGSIAGTVTDPDGSPQPNVCAKAHRVGSDAISTAETDASGDYQINRLATGDYKVEFEDCNGVGLVGEYYDDRPDQASADVVQVAAPTSTTGIDAVLAIDSGEDTGSLSGQVTDDSLAPLSGVCVTAYPDGGSGAPGADATDGNGDYEITGLAEDDYRVEFASCGAPGPVFITEYYDDQPELELADPVFVAAGSPSGGVDAALEVDPNVDLSPPQAPSITASAPSSPGNVNAPRLVGTAESGSTVRIYPSSDCTGTPVTGTAAQFASPGIQVAAVTDNSTTSYTATAADPSNNTSTCSGAFDYTEDSIAPAAPTLGATSPTSPANDNNPEVSGTAEGGSTVRIYKTPNCTGTVAATAGASALGGAGITVNVPGDATTTFSATATDAAGNTSPCSASLAYVEDSIAPAAPSLSSTSPASPANDAQPEVVGSAENGSTVRIYTTSGCTGSSVATGSAAQLSAPGLSATVTDNSTTQFRATATDVAGNVSPCSSARTYVEDSNPPAAPSLTSTDPASTGSANDPKLKGSAESGSTVRVYTTSECSGTATATGGAGQLADPGITVNVGSNSTTDFRATATDAAGNTSPCSSPRTYVEDSNAPAAPTIGATSPASPANDNNPEVSGTAEGGSTVRIYTTGNCTGTVVATAGASALGGAGITVNVPGDATTTFSATATDAAGNTSPCSASLAYVEDSTPPAAPTIAATDPASPASDNSPKLKGNAASGSTIKVYATGDCTGTVLGSGTTAELEGAGIALSVPSDSISDLRATATDAAGNVSACSAARRYVEDSTAPTAAFSSGPSGTTNDASGAFGLRAGEVNVSFRCSLDAGAFSPCSATPSFGPLAAGPHTLAVTATDAAGNEGPAAERNWVVDPSAGEAEMSGGAAAGGVVTNDPAGLGPAAGRPATVAVTLPGGGSVTIVGLSPTALAPPSGYSLLGAHLDISAPAATPSQPLRLDFRLDSSQIPAGTDRSLVTLLRDGSPASDCLGSAQATPSPCVTLRTTLGDGDLRIVVLTAQASSWRFAVAQAPPPPPPTGGGGTGGDPPPSDPGGTAGGDGGGAVNPPTPVPQCVVPKLKGMSKSAAAAALAAARCTLGKVMKKKVKKGKSGRVLAQSPAAGQALAAGAPVSVTVSVVRKKK